MQETIWPCAKSFVIKPEWLDTLYDIKFANKGDDMKHLLVIDGTTEYGEYLTDHCSPPYAIFDVDAQRNIVVGIRWYWLARLIRWWYS